MKNFVIGLETYYLKEEERDFIKKHKPCGVILFARNIKNRELLIKLNEDLKNINDYELMIMVDQEGGKVARIKPPMGQEYPAASFFGELYLRNSKSALDAVHMNYKMLSNELKDYGFNVVCAPVADLSCKGAHDVIGNRSFSSDPDIVIALARASMQSISAVGVIPIIKHVPGHGRAKSDSHYDLPRIKASLEELEQTDFRIFKELKDAPMAMTAHIIYDALDRSMPATISRKAIDYIRNDIGFKNILISDDICMKALNGSYAQLTKQINDAGVDITLYCQFNLDEAKDISNYSRVIEPIMHSNLTLFK